METRSQEERFTKMTTAPVEKLVCGLAVPSIGSMMVSAIYNTVDTFFVGRTGTQSVAALGIVFSFMVITQAIAFMFGHGSGNYISRALGRRDSSTAATMAATGFFSAITVSAAIATTAICFMEPVLRVFGATPTIMPVAKDYFFWIAVGAPFITGTFVINNQMRLQGNARLALRGIMSGALLNMVLDPIFIFGFDMGVAGAGLATALSQLTSFTVLLSLTGKNGGIAIRPRNFHLQGWYYKEILAGGLPSLFRQGTMGLVTICLNNVAGLYGDSVIAAFSITQRLTMLSNSILIGFGQGFQPVCGFNYGAGLYARVRKAFWFCVRTGSVYCFAVAIVAFTFAPGLISIFRADDPDVISFGTLVLRCNSITYGFLGLIIMSNMFLQNIRYTRSAIVVAVAREGIFFLPTLILIHLLWGKAGLPAVQPVSDVLAFILSLILSVKALQDMKKKENDGF